jgi:hypothetical protein
VERLRGQAEAERVAEVKRLQGMVQQALERGDRAEAERNAMQWRAESAESDWQLAEGENTRLKAALIAHRADLHNFSRRPCPTCQQSAAALGLTGKVPDHCARGDE